MRQLILLSACVGLVLLVSRPSMGQSKETIAGTWVMDRGKSDFMPDNDTLRSRKIVFEAVENGLKCTITSVIEQGNGRTTIDSTFVAHFDGKDVPIDNSALDTVALRRIDGQTIERTGKIRGKPAETATLKVSADGKVLTITTMGSADGEDYKSTQIFDRQ